MRPQTSPTDAGRNLSAIFEEHRDELYWLAFLLTADRERSADAFTRALDLKDSANPVFRQFMVSWARKLVIAEALAGIDSQLRDSMARLQAADPAPVDALPSPEWMSRQGVTRQEFEHAVLALDVFERCAVLLTVFERLSIADTALLLNADAALVKKAQVRGLIELTRQIAQDRGWDPSPATRKRGMTQLRAAVMNI